MVKKAGNAKGYVDNLGGPPDRFRGGLYDEDHVEVNGSLEIAQAHQAHKNGRPPASGFSLRGVREVLTEYGLDPAAEIAKILQKQVEVRDRAGNVLRDDDGNVVMRDVIDGEVRLKTLMALQDFVSPRLKAVEVTHKGPELTEEQLNQRIERLAAASKVSE